MSEGHGPEAAPVVTTETPAPATPSVEPAPAATPAAASSAVEPVAAPAPEAPAPAAPTAEKPAEPAPSLLGAEPPATEAPVVEPAAYEFTLPEGFKADPERMAAFTGLLGEHKLPPEAGQKLFDLYMADRQALQEQMAAHQQEVFAETRKGWVADFENDPQMGLNRRDQTLNQARTAIRQLLTDKNGQVNEKHLQEAWQVLGFTGAGDHPAIIRLFANAHQRLNERAAPPPSLGAPPRRNGASDPASRRYANMPDPGIRN